MKTNDISSSLTTLFSELVDGANNPGGAFVLNSGDVGLLRSLDKLSAKDASDSLHGGATIAAHARHLQYDLSLMNRWARDGGDPFSDAKSEEAWTTSMVDEREWREIRDALRDDARAWLSVLGTPRDVNNADLCGMIASVVHLAYHLGAMRQIARTARGPKDGTVHLSTAQGAE
jgi:hypothetical protein